MDCSARGLGQSNSKRSYLPQAYNDFIFAVIGEELGVVGALLVIGLFAAVLWVGLRVALRSTDPFLRMLSAVATLWIVLQALINIAYVVGLLPVTGLQLPLISAGGTSMLTTLLMFGLIAHAAYREPEARVSLDSSTSPRLVTRIFGRPRLGSDPRPVRAPKIRRPARPTPPADRPGVGAPRRPPPVSSDRRATAQKSVVEPALSVGEVLCSPACRFGFDRTVRLDVLAGQAGRHEPHHRDLDHASRHVPSCVRSPARCVSTVVVVPVRVGRGVAAMRYRLDDVTDVTRGWSARYLCRGFSSPLTDGPIRELRSQVLGRRLQFVHRGVRGRDSNVCAGQPAVEVVDRGRLRCELLGGAQIVGEPVHTVEG